MVQNALLTPNPTPNQRPLAPTGEGIRGGRRGGGRWVSGQVGGAEGGSGSRPGWGHRMGMSHVDDVYILRDFFCVNMFIFMEKMSGLNGGREWMVLGIPKNRDLLVNWWRVWDIKVYKPFISIDESKIIKYVMRSFKNTIVANGFLQSTWKIFLEPFWDPNRIASEAARPCLPWLKPWVL